MRNRINASKLDFSEILADEVEAELKVAALISKGVESSDLELVHIRELCDKVLSFAEDRAQIYDNLKFRMNNVAPNLTALAGEIVGARLISRAATWGTVQILGAEKALSRALKTKHATPKHGIIYHASLVSQASPKHKGKMSRSLAAKIALAIKCDAFGDGQNNTFGLESRAKLEARLEILKQRI
ncbi:unnamed protein product [Arabis nemorensis]|uniref:Nop domain-containing protein n=1 Tax=Arabis nemorensis TaxID=586526 RepID=A0A565BG03_9BRAS|nr:unnamed protein product [Arabis nemorensis]